MNIRNVLAIAASATLLAAAPVAMAQQSGLVNVEISNVANDIARNLSVDVSQIPVSVQVPVGVAANVCGVAANVLAQQKGATSGGCTAKNSSTALNEVVQKQLKKG
jgi:hypothetical protein